MSSWARRAADISSVVTSCGHPGASAPDYTYRLEKVKFGVPLEEVCKNNENIPGPLLVLILKLNKESPNRRDVFRAPGHQGAMKKLIHFLQSGRLVNVDNYSVYTIASVLKKFLRKIPNGIFGRTGEKELFDIIELDNELEQTDRLHRLFTSLPKYTQRLLVLLFGTFRVIASNATQASTGMTSEALGVSVAPSFFQSCVSDGKTARMEDVLKFKVATKIMKQIIDKFATHDLFGRENYEYYARVTGRILKVQDEWICSFQYPPPPRGKLAQQKYALQHSLEAEKTWLQCQCERWGLLGNIRLSNSAESIQYPATTARRPSTRRLIGVNVPRQYPLRSSLRRNREKQVGSGNTINGSGNSVTDSNGLLTTNVGAVGGAGGMLPVATAPPSVRNSIAECCSNIGTMHDSPHILIPAYPFNRLEDCTSSLERKRTQLRTNMDGDSEHAARESVCDSRSGAMCELSGMLMDTTESMKDCDNVDPTYVYVSGNNNLVYATTGITNNMPTLITTRNLENVVGASTTAQQQRMSIQNQSSDGVQTAEGVSTITFKAPRV
ncbi:uncharacterized protein LOC105214780 isoform X7 [Zeugodacus cucurbitae]|uniref:uncharacterized protein LOC105214780 isoform X7 n=1 Tax=Zeugodacus cucurbitae TaxID=28588 RepID=UPI0023D948B8|nr:uncharacterized protein LOC105214780 isoform X7 [Zeugodacus cucurbitae]